MAAANSNFNEIVTTTLKNRRKKLADNVLNHNALLRKLSAKGNVNTADGGETLVEELEYAENTTFKYYSGYEVLDVTPSEVFSAAEFDWKQAAVVVSASGLELRKNSGAERTINLLDKRIRNAEKTMMNNISIGVYSDGSGTSGKQVGGLTEYVKEVPTSGVVGGIDRDPFAFWRNQTSGDVTIDATTIQLEMNEMWLKLVRGGDHPDIIVASAKNFSFFWTSLQAIQRITSSDKASKGWQSIEFVGPGGTAPVFHDDAVSDTSITGGDDRMYMLNTDYIFWRPHTAANMKVLEQRDSFNQDAIAVPVIFMGNLTMSNASLQGVIFT
jgi:hypothetical protein